MPKKLSEKDAIIKDIWIMTTAGTLIYSQSLQKEESDIILCGLVSALSSFAKKVTDSDLTSMIMQNHSFQFKTYGDLIITCRCNRKAKGHRVQEYIENVYRGIEEHYGHVIKHWDGNMNAFKGIGRIVDLHKDTNFLGVNIDRKAAEKILDSL